MAEDGGDIYEHLLQESCFFSSSAHKEVFTGRLNTLTNEEMWQLPLHRALEKCADRIGKFPKTVILIIITIINIVCKDVDVFGTNTVSLNLIF